MVDDQAFPVSQEMDLGMARPPSLLCQLPHSLLWLLITISRHRPVIVAYQRHAHQQEGPPLSLRMTGHRIHDRQSAGLRRERLIDSGSLNVSLSSVGQLQYASNLGYQHPMI